MRIREKRLGTHLTILTNANIFEGWSALNFDFIDEDANAAGVSGDLTHGATESRSLLLQVTRRSRIKRRRRRRGENVV